MPGGGVAVAQGARRLAGLGQGARRARPGVRAGRRRTASSAARRPRTCPTAERAGLAAHVGAAPGRRGVLRRRARPAPSQALLGRRPARDRPPLRADRRGRRGRSSGWSTRRCSSRRPRPGPAATSRSAPAPGPPCTTPFTSPKPEWIDRFEEDPGRRAGLRLRHRLQRQRDRRRVDPYPPPRRAGAGLRADGPHRGRGAGEVRLPARRVRLRRPAARRHRVRLGPDLRPAVPAPTRSATSSRSRRAAAASTR